MLRRSSVWCAVAVCVLALLTCQQQQQASAQQQQESNSSASVGGIDGDGDFSPELRALLQADHAFSQSMRNKSSGLGAISQSTVFHLDTAMKLFWHSVSAYCTDDASLQDWTCHSCSQFGDFTITGIMDDTANQGYVGYFTQGLPHSPIETASGPLVPASAPFVVVSMRGTVPSMIKDWIEDLSSATFGAFSQKHPDVLVHSGFWGAYQDMKPGMMAALKTALSASGANTILVTGHSLGGAMAELAAVDLSLNEYPDLYYGAYTQGTPRVGNQAWADLVTSTLEVSFREVHNRDIVPHLPPLLMKYRHGLEEIFWDATMTSYQACFGTPLGEDPKCSNQFTLPISITDHLTYHDVHVGTYCSSSKQTADSNSANSSKPIGSEQRA